MSEIVREHKNTRCEWIRPLEINVKFCVCVCVLFAKSLANIN